MYVCVCACVRVFGERERVCVCVPSGSLQQVRCRADSGAALRAVHKDCEVSNS
jgi:hypothetical protein